MAAGSTRVEASQHVDELVGGGEALLLGEAGDRVDVVVDHAVEPLHQIEGRADHRVVGAFGDLPGHRHVGGFERRLHPVLAAHVVRGGEDPVQGRPPEDPVVVAVAYPEREVRRPARELRDLHAATRTGHVRGDPRAEPIGRDRLGHVDRGRLLGGHQKFAASLSSRCANRSRSSAFRVGTCRLGQPSTGL